MICQRNLKANLFKYTMWYYYILEQRKSDHQEGRLIVANGQQNLTTNSLYELNYCYLPEVFHLYPVPLLVKYRR